MRDEVADEQIAEVAAQPRQGHGPWSRVELRVASLEDAVTFGLHRIAILLRPEVKLKPPEMVPRPGVVSKKNRRRSLSQADREYLQYLRDHQGALPPGYTAIAAG